MGAEDGVARARASEDVRDVTFQIGAKAALQQADLYYAFHKDTDDYLIQALNKTLQEMKQLDTTGKSSVDRIIESYMVS